jgi:hypothetical protein
LQLRRRAGLVVVLLASCFGPDPNLTPTGKGLPQLTIDFPAVVEPASVHDLTVTVDNPGPADMTAFFIAFGTVGVGGQVGVARPLLAPGPPRGASPSVVSVEPKPIDVGQGGLVFKFGPLQENDSATVTFSVKAPRDAGRYANSVQAYDAQEIDRIRGLKLETEVKASASG